MKINIFLILFFVASQLNSESTSGFGFLKIPFGSARFQGLGGNGVSLFEGAESLRVNPAGIGFSQMNELNFSIISWLDDFSGKYLSYVKPYGRSVIGIDFAYFSTDDLEIRDERGITINSDDVSFKDIYVSFSLAKSFLMEKFSIGASVKHLREDRYEKADDGFVYDLGAIIKFSRKFKVGVSKQNISGDSVKIVDIFRYGGSLNIGENLLLTVESVKFTDSKAKTSFGFEITIPENVLQYGKFILRSGYSKSPKYGKNYDDSFLKKLGLDDVSGWSFGVGVYSSQVTGKSYGLEYSFTPYGELGKTSQITFKFQF